MAIISRMTRSTGALALAALLATRGVLAQQGLCVKTFSMVVVDSSDDNLDGGYAVVVPNPLNPQVNTITFTNDPTAVTGEFMLSSDGRLMTLDGLIANTDSGVDFDYFFFDTPEEIAANPALVPIICSVAGNRLTCGAEGNDVIQYCDGNLSIGDVVNDIIPCAAVTLETDPLQFEICVPGTSTTIIIDPTTLSTISTALSTSTDLSITETSSTTTVVSTSTVGASSSASTDLGVPTTSTSSTTASTILNSSSSSSSSSASSASSASTNLANPTDLTTSTSTSTLTNPNGGVTTLTSTVLPVMTTTIILATQTVTRTISGSATTLTSTYPIWTTTCQVGATPIAPIWPGPTALPYMPVSNSTHATYAPHHYAALPSALIKCNKPAAPMPTYTPPAAPGGGYGGDDSPSAPNPGYGNNGYNGYPNSTAPAPGGNYGSPAAPGKDSNGGAPGSYNGGAPGSYNNGPAGNAPPAATGSYVPYPTGPVAFEGGAAGSLQMAFSGVLAAAVMVACFML